MYSSGLKLSSLLRTSSVQMSLVGQEKTFLLSLHLNKLYQPIYTELTIVYSFIDSKS